MKKTTIRFLALALALCLLLPALSSCGSGGAAVRYKDFSLSKAIFQYQCSMDKTTYLYEANNTTREKTPTSQLQDVPAIWAMEDADGTSVADTLKNEAVAKMKWLLYLEQYAKDHGGTLTAEQKSSVQNSLNEFIKKNFKTKDEFNKAMKPYGITYNDMLEYNYHQGLASLGSDLLFGEKGEKAITDASLKAYFEKNYLTCSFVYINDQTKTLPNNKTVHLSDSEKTEKRALADSLYERALAGEDVGELYRTYSDRKTGEEGVTYTFARGTLGNEEAEAALADLNVGAITKVTTTHGIFILQRRSLNEAWFTQEKETIREALEEEKKQEILTGDDAAFQVDQSFVDGIDIATLPFVR